MNFLLQTENVSSLLKKKKRIMIHWRQYVRRSIGIPGHTYIHRLNVKNNFVKHDMNFMFWCSLCKVVLLMGSSFPIFPQFFSMEIVFLKRAVYFYLFLLGEISVYFTRCRWFNVITVVRFGSRELSGLILNGFYDGYKEYNDVEML